VNFSIISSPDNGPACEIADAIGDPIPDAVFTDGNCTLQKSGIGVAVELAAAARYALHPVRPAPSRSRVTFRYDLGQSGEASLHVFDVRGRLVKILVDDIQQLGPHSVAWATTDGSGWHVASGVYIIRMRAGEFAYSRKFLILR
jgi:hypothetical protein